MFDKQTAERITNQIIAELMKGVSPWHKPWKAGIPMSIDNRPYRGINAILLGFNDYADPRYITFKKCNQLGGHIKKGEKGHFIMYWNFIEKDIMNKETGKMEKKTYPIAIGYNVWNVTQCEGLPEKYSKWEKSENNPIAEAESIWEKYADKPALEHNMKSAYYVPAKDFISIPEMSLFDSADNYYSTLFHEVIHSTGHEKRLNRDQKMFCENVYSYGKEELIAELGSQILCQYAGITNTIPNSASYCLEWAKTIKEMPVNAILSIASQAQKAADYVMGKKFSNTNEVN